MSSDITRTYAFDCATFKVDYKESPDSDYKYELEIPSNTELKAVSTSNKVMLCGIPLCIPQVLKFTISKKLKTETDFRKIFTEEFEKTLGKSYYWLFIWGHVCDYFEYFNLLRAITENIKW